MTIQIHFEWRKNNLDATVKHFFESKHLPDHIRKQEFDGATEFLLGRLRLLLSEPLCFQLPENLCKPFECTFQIYKIVWFTTVVEQTELAGNDRKRGILTERNVVPQLDAGILEEIMVEFPSAVTGTLTASSHFLTLLK